MTSEDLKKYWANFMVVFNKYWGIFSVAFKKYWTIYKDAFKSKWYVKVLTAIASLILLLFLFIKAVDVNFLCMFGESPSTEVLANPNSVEASEIYSDDGVLIGKYFTENRSSVEIEDISDELLITLVHTEDERFFEHHGVDYSGLLGAFKDALLGNARGASTITQQLAKNLFKMRSTYNNGILCKVPGLKTLIIKIKEWNAAKRIEASLTPALSPPTTGLVRSTTPRSPKHTAPQLCTCMT